MFLDIIPFFRFLAGIVCFGLFFFFLNIMVSGVQDYISFPGDYAAVLLALWAGLPTVVLFFAGVRLIMVMQKRGG